MASVPNETQPLLAEDEATQNRQPTPLPKLQISILMLLLLAEPVTSHCIYPFINQLVSELDITGGDEKKVGYYAGLIESIFFATQALVVFQWARLSDHIGRKPVLLIGIGGLAISMVCFGLSRTFWTLVASRSIVGILNGNVGVMKSLLGEITDETNIAQGFAIIPISWSIGITIGPVIGGQLAKPHDRWPDVFSHPFWTKFPYFLPCAVSAGFSTFCFMIILLFLKETIPRRRSSGSVAESCNEALPPRHDTEPPPLRTVLTRPVIVSVSNYGALALVEIALLALLPLFYATPIELGGLGLPPPTIGFILGSLGLLNGLVQWIFFAKAIAVWGPKRTFQLGMAVFASAYAMFPAINMCAKARGIDNTVWALVFAQLALLVVVDFAFGAIFLYVSSSAPNNRSLGAVNGVAQFLASAARALGPAASTSLFATALERNWLGGYAVYAILSVFSVACACLSLLLPPKIWPKAVERRRE